jgi:hypothetical protein
MKETPQIKEANSRFLGKFKEKSFINPISLPDVEVVEKLTEMLHLLGVNVKQVMESYKVLPDEEMVEVLSDFLLALDRDLKRKESQGADSSKPAFFCFVNSPDELLMRFRDMGTVKKGSDRKGAFILVDGLSSNTKAVRIDYTEEVYRDADYSELIEIISQ